MPVVTNMDSIWSSATFVAAMDTNFAITNLMTLREGDTLNVLQGIVQLLDLEVDSRGHLLATGVFTDSFLINNTLYHALSVPDPSFDATDVLVVDFKPDLSLDTLYLSEGSGSETGWRVVAGKPAELFVGGNFNGHCSFPPYTAISTTSPPEWTTDVFYARLKWAGDATDVTSRHGASLQLFPNPTRTEFRVGLPDMRELTVTGLDGRVVTQRFFGTGTFRYSLSVANWPAGIYLVNVRDGAGKTYTGKLVKE